MKKISALLMMLALTGGASSLMAQEMPEALYLTGGPNGAAWMNPSQNPEENVIKLTGDGSGNYTGSVKYDEWDTQNSSQFPYSLWDSETAEQYYGAVYPENTFQFNIFSDRNAEVELATQGSYIHVTALASYEFSVDWNAKSMTISSKDAMEYPTKLTFQTESGKNYDLTPTGNPNYWEPDFEGKFSIPENELTGWLVVNDKYKYGVSRYGDYYLFGNLSISTNTTLLTEGSTNVVPLKVSNWNGGTVEIFTSNVGNKPGQFYLSIGGSEQPELPSQVYLVGAMNKWDVNNKDYPLDLEFKETGTGNYFAYEGDLQIPGHKFDTKIYFPGIGLLGLEEHISFNLYKGQAGYVYAAFLSQLDNSFEVANWVGGPVTITLPVYSSPLIFGQIRISGCSYQPLPENEYLYLVGAPQGWNINNDEMELKQTSAFVFEGRFEINPGDAMFRFYRALGDWESNSIGVQYDDYPIDCEFDSNGFYNGWFTEGKGSWNFPNWPGGDMYFKVDIFNRIVEFQNCAVAGVQTVGEGHRLLKAVKGGIRVEANDGSRVEIFNLQGKRVAVVEGDGFVNLPAGIYLSKGEKLLVR